MSNDLTTNFLKVQGNRIINQKKQPVQLKGVTLGGWLNIESPINGFFGNESALRKAIYKQFGKEKGEVFFNTFLEYYINEDDIAFIQSLGLNLIRIPINYHHFEDDINPMVVKEKGFEHLDRLISLCAEYKIHTIIELATVPGGQNSTAKCDNEIHKPLLWTHKHFQDRLVNIWGQIASRYALEQWVVGYNLIHQPSAPTEKTLSETYQRISKAIRKVDPYHILFIEGNHYPPEFDNLTKITDNVVYTIQQYPFKKNTLTNPNPTTSETVKLIKKHIEDEFIILTHFMHKHNLPIWINKFAPLYQTNELNAELYYAVLKEQIEIYDRYNINWTTWLYKDIGVQGLVSPKKNSKWMKQIKLFLKKKNDLMTADESEISEHLREPIDQIATVIKHEFPQYSFRTLFSRQDIKSLIMKMLIAKPLLHDFVSCFKKVSQNEIDFIMQSFLFDNCEIRSELAHILSGKITS